MVETRAEPSVSRPRTSPLGRLAALLSLGCLATPLLPSGCGLEEYVIEDEDADADADAGESAGDGDGDMEDSGSESDDEGDNEGEGDGDESESGEDGDTNETGDSPAQEPELSLRDAAPPPRPRHASR